MKKFIVSFKVKAEKRFIDDLVDPDSRIMYNMLDGKRYPWKLIGTWGEVSRLDDNEALIQYEMTVVDEFPKDEAKKWEHHLDYIVDFSTYDDIKSVYGCEVVEVE